MAEPRLVAAEAYIGSKAQTVNTMQWYRRMTSPIGDVLGTPTPEVSFSRPTNSAAHMNSNCGVACSPLDG